MSKISTFITRGDNIESVHGIKCIVLNKKKEILLSTNNNKDLIFPRSSIKIFQALPFILSGASKKYNLNSRQVALACSSHTGENFHLIDLKNWFEKLKIKMNKLKCGIHNPINLASSDKLLLSGNKPDQLHNNCSGKHLAMLSSCLVNNYNLNNYLETNHPHQKKIRDILELYMNKKINKKNYSVDGCSAPQYAFELKDLSEGLINLISSYNDKFAFNYEIKFLINNILNNPMMIGGKKRFDSELIKICNKKLFCKGGAEGVFLFAHLKKEIAGAIKVIDGNERAVPSAVAAILKKLKITSHEENYNLKIWLNSFIYNHAKTITGKIFTKIN